MRGDYEILTGIRRKEQASLETAVRRYAKYVAAVVRKTLGPMCTSQDVEELSSDVFVALWENAEKLQDDSDLKYWLAVVARNASIKRQKKFKYTETLEENLIFDSSPEGKIEQEEQIRLVRIAVDSMEAVDREIFLRHYFWRQTVGQIAGEMGKNQSAIKSRLARGREKLRKVLMREDCLL